MVMGFVELFGRGARGAWWGEERLVMEVMIRHGM